MSAVAGKVKSTGLDRVILQTSSGMVEVIAAEGARMYSGAYGTVASAGAFIVGDRIGAEGRRTAEGLLAMAIGSIFAPLKARITRVSADRSIAYTSAGVIQLSAGRLPGAGRSPSPDLGNEGVSPGDVINGLGWTHPITGETFLLLHG
jgi:hypothetical protein